MSAEKLRREVLVEVLDRVARPCSSSVQQLTKNDSPTGGCCWFDDGPRFPWGAAVARLLAPDAAGVVALRKSQGVGVALDGS